jgi:hypothetical protein
MAVHNIHGHCGFDRLSYAVKQHWYFRDLHSLCFQLARTCSICQKVKIDQSSTRLGLNPLKPTNFGESWSIDHLKLARSTPNGANHILVMVEATSGWIELALCKSTTSLETSTHIMDKIIANHGIPRILHCDRSTAFVNSLLRAISNLLSIKTVLASSRAPWSNGLAESRVKSVKETIKLYCQNDLEIEAKLPMILIALRTTKSRAADASPCYILRGHEMTLPIIGNEAGSPLSENLRPSSKESEYFHSLANSLKEIQENARKNVAANKEAMKKQYDRKFKVKDPGFVVGSRVFLENKQIKARSDQVISHPRYDGPYIVTAVIENNDMGKVYKLVHSLTGRVHKSLINARRLKMAYSADKLIAKYKPEVADAKPVDDERRQVSSQSQSVDKWQY